MKKERIDKLLVDVGFAESRTRAQALIMAGVVLVDEKRVEKPSEIFAPGAVIRVKDSGPESRYVSRAGLKLEGALDHFGISPEGYACLDIGSSTGGFTDCLLQRGAASVIAIDVGTNQLAWKIRNDPRVEVRENVNARSLQPTDFTRAFDLIVMDVSFISVTKILPRLVELICEGGRIVVLIKPQFEVGKGEVGKGGIVRESEKHERVVIEVNSFAAGLGLSLAGTIESPITGAEGNKEFLSCYEMRSRSVEGGGETRKLVDGVDYYLENGFVVLSELYLLGRGYCCDNGCRHCPYPKEAVSVTSE